MIHCGTGAKCTLPVLWGENDQEGLGRVSEFNEKLPEGAQQLVDTKGGQALSDDGKMDEEMSGEREKEELSETVCILKQSELIVKYRRVPYWVRAQLLQRGKAVLKLW